MPEDIGSDHLVVIKIEGMHCHRCEQTIQKNLCAQPGVREVEVDFASGQASVLYDGSKVNVNKLMDAVNQAGYQAKGFTQNHGSRALK